MYSFHDKKQEVTTNTRSREYSSRLLDKMRKYAFFLNNREWTYHLVSFRWPRGKRTEVNEHTPRREDLQEEQCKEEREKDRIKCTTLLKLWRMKSVAALREILKGISSRKPQHLFTSTYFEGESICQASQRGIVSTTSFAVRKVRPGNLRMTENSLRGREREVDDADLSLNWNRSGLEILWSTSKRKG